MVFTSDHGDQLGEHGMLGKFYNTYEGSLKVPSVLRIPKARKKIIATALGICTLVDECVGRIIKCGTFWICTIV